MNDGFSDTAAQPTTTASLRGFLSASRDYLHARLQLFKIEAAQAGTHFAVIAALAGGLMVFAILAYLLLVLAGIFALGALIGGDYGAALGALIIAAVHLAVGAALLLFLRKKMKESVFEASLDEFKKDQQWLTQTSRR